jgi:DNA-directed RNA polymerase subunit K/omega
LAENDKEEVVEEKESVEDAKGKAEQKAEKKAEKMVEESDNVNRNRPANKYELAIVAAQEARRMNETWTEEDEREGARVTEKALKRARKGNVYYTVVDEQDS